MGIENVRFRRPVYAGDQVVITATVKWLRSKMGWLHGVATVNGEVCAEGTMTFALGPREDQRWRTRISGGPWIPARPADRIVCSGPSRAMRWSGSAASSP